MQERRVMEDNGSRVVIKGNGAFDHFPILLDTQLNCPRNLKPFIFEPLWVNHNSFKELTSKTWQDNQLSLSQTVTKFQGKLKIWNFEHFGNIFQELKKTKARLYNLRKKIQQYQLLLLERNLHNKIKNLLKYEENN